MQRQTLNETIREDGLRIITKKMPHTKRTRIILVNLCGSAADPPDKDGLAHLFEHMAFKGTSSRPSKDLQTEMDRYCQEKGAYTDRLRTVYYAECVSRNTDRVLGLLFDIYTNSVFPADELEKEKEVVFNEIARDQDEDGYVAWFAVWNMLWKRNPLRKFGVGTVPGVTAVDKDLLVRVHRDWYVPSKTVVIGIGDIKHDDLVYKLSWLMPVKPGSAGILNGTEYEWDDEHREPPSEKERTIPRNGSEKAVVAIGQKIPNRGNMPERDVMSFTIVERMLDSMLFEEIRNKRGFAYVTSARTDGDYQLGHYFEMTSETLPNRVQEVKQLMLDVVYRMPLDRSLFTGTKGALLDQFTYSAESGRFWEAYLMRHMVERKAPLQAVRGLIRSRMKTLETLTFEEAVSVREKLLKPELAACAITQPAGTDAFVCLPDDRDREGSC